MNKIEQKLHTLAKKIKNISLLAEDKRADRAKLSLYIQEHPVEKEQEVSSVPFFAHYRMKFHSSAITTLRGVMVGVIGAVLVSGGVASAATGALPGDILYPVKVNLNEKVRSVMALTPEAEARLQAELAERRLREAEKLAVQGKLSVQTEKTLEARFQEHSEASARSLSDIHGKDRAQVVTQIQSKFEAALSAHAELLSQLAKSMTPEQKKQLENITSIPAEGATSSPATTTAETANGTTSTSSDAVATGTTKVLETATGTASSTSLQPVASDTNTTSSSESQSKPKQMKASVMLREVIPPVGAKGDSESGAIESILSWVQSKQAQITASREKAQAQVWTGERSQVKNFVEGTKAGAQAQMSSAENLYTENTTNIPDELRDELKKNIANAKDHFKQGNADLNEKDYSSAFYNFQATIRESVKAQVLIKTSKGLKPYDKIHGFDGSKLQITHNQPPEAAATTSTTTQKTGGTSTASSTASSSLKENASGTDEASL